MAISTCFSLAQIFSRVKFQNDTGCQILRNQNKLMLDARLPVSLLQSLSTRHLHAPREWSLGGGHRVAAAPDIGRLRLSRIRPGTCSCGMVGSQLASTAFTVGTAAVLPLYTLMIVAPKEEIVSSLPSPCTIHVASSRIEFPCWLQTKKAMDSSVPYVVLGLVYAYLLYLSWTPDTIRLMFTSKYWLPELPGIAKMFSSEMTLASAWIHLLVVDLFAARCIYHDGLESEVETRHSISLCLLVCPIGILTHTITKSLTGTRYGSSKHNTEM